MTSSYAVNTELVPDGSGSGTAPLLPEPYPRRRRRPGRLPVADRVAPAGIICALRTGVAWRDVPSQVVGASGVTAWRRLLDWTEAGVCHRLREALLAELRRAGLLDMDAAASGGSHIRALKRGKHVGPSPVGRGRSGSKHHLIVDRHGTLPGVTLIGGNRHDGTQFLPLLDAIPSVRGLPGRPRRRPRRLFADLGYDYDRYRRPLWKRGLRPLIARRRVANGSGLGKTRWVVERTFVRLHQFKRLRIRYEIRADLDLGPLELACSIICLRRLRTSF
ncbi:IS5 family transposase [Kitasatospora indigofera]